jgi:hypothetical protein
MTVHASGHKKSFRDRIGLGPQFGKYKTKSYPNQAYTGEKVPYCMKIRDY